jgi:isopentenyl-diphosphate delta-isomerase
MSTYYEQSICIPQVDASDTVLGKVERWQAHENGILHRAITVGLKVEDRYILQHRKHPVFDKWFDLTASSHPIYYDDGTVQTNEDAVYKTLEREWGIIAEKVKGLYSPGYVKYKAEDPNSKYIEHEVCHLFLATVDDYPTFNSDVAYGFTLQTADQIMDLKNPLSPALAAWVKAFIKNNLVG